MNFRLVPRFSHSLRTGSSQGNNNFSLLWFALGRRLQPCFAGGISVDFGTYFLASSRVPVGGVCLCPPAAAGPAQFDEQRVVMLPSTGLASLEGSSRNKN
eukprot:1469832-Rhodomonas_salina.4